MFLLMFVVVFSVEVFTIFSQLGQATALFKARGLLETGG